MTMKARVTRRRSLSPWKSSAQLRYDAMESELQVSWAMLLAAVGEDVLPNDLTREQTVSELALELRTRWAKSKDLLK